MKTNIFVIVIMLVTVSGCASYRSATLDPNDSVKFNDTNISLLQRSIDPIELATSKAIIMEAESKAKFNEALAKQITQGNAATVAGQIVGVFINEDSRKTVIIQHPTMAQEIVIKSKGYEFITVTQIPKYITIRFTGDKRNRKYQVHKQTGVYNGVNIEFGARVNSQNYTY